MLGEDGRHGRHRRAPAGDVAETAARLERALAGTGAAHAGATRRELLAKRDALLALAGARGVSEDAPAPRPFGDRADDWDGPGAAPADDAALYLELDGWEGPLDLLLDLARRQKVDLKAISILALVDQYLAYIERAEALRLELAADYLVMAAWLAYLKSALLLPREEQEDPSPEELALRLQLRLAAARRDARGGGAADGARPAGPRRVRARRARGAAGRPQEPAGSATGSRWSRPMARSRRAPRRWCTWCATAW